MPLPPTKMSSRPLVQRLIDLIVRKHDCPSKPRNVPASPCHQRRYRNLHTCGPITQSSKNRPPSLRPLAPWRAALLSRAAGWNERPLPPLRPRLRPLPCSHWMRPHAPQSLLTPLHTDNKSKGSCTYIIGPLHSMQWAYNTCLVISMMWHTYVICLAACRSWPAAVFAFAALSPRANVPYLLLLSLLWAHFMFLVT